MKHLLRKLHIGGGGLNDQHQRLAETRPVTTPISNQTPSTPSTSSSATMVGRMGVVDSSSADRTAADGGSGSGSGSGRGGGGGGGGGGVCVDFNFLEEEFQVQLALAISASDLDS